MKKWEYESIADGTGRCGRLADWPELGEALEASGISLLLDTPMKAVREICRLILAERKTTTRLADADEAKRLQAELLDRGVYASRHDIAECYHDFCESFASAGWLAIGYWDDADHIGPVDYIAARIGNGKPN